MSFDLSNYIQVQVVNTSVYVDQGKMFIVKPWSKSWSQQAPQSNQSQIKRKKEGFGPWADSKITWATHHISGWAKHP